MSSAVIDDITTCDKTNITKDKSTRDIEEKEQKKKPKKTKQNKQTKLSL